MIISRLSLGERSILETVINRLEAYVPATGVGYQRVVAICNKIKLIPARLEIDALRIGSRRLPLPRAPCSFRIASHRIASYRVASQPVSSRPVTSRSVSVRSSYNCARGKHREPILSFYRLLEPTGKHEKIKAERETSIQEGRKQQQKRTCRKKLNPSVSRGSPLRWPIHGNREMI